MRYLALELDLGGIPGLGAGDLAGVAHLVHHGPDQDAPGVHVREGDNVLLPRSIRQADSEVALQQRRHRVSIKFLREIRVRSREGGEWGRRRRRR